jgi:hypothetical protein
MGNSFKCATKLLNEGDNKGGTRHGAFEGARAPCGRGLDYSRIQ